MPTVNETTLLKGPSIMYRQRMSHKINDLMEGETFMVIRFRFHMEKLKFIFKLNLTQTLKVIWVMRSYDKKTIITKPYFWDTL